MRILRSITIRKASSHRSLMSLCYRTISSCCSCAYVEILSTWEVWRALKRLELHSAAPRATLTPLSCSPNFPRAQYLDIRTLMHELIVKQRITHMYNLKRLKNGFRVYSCCCCCFFFLFSFLRWGQFLDYNNFAILWASE